MTFGQIQEYTKQTLFGLHLMLAYNFLRLNKCIEDNLACLLKLF